MSLSQIILICNWVLEGNLKNKFVAFGRNKMALVVSSLLLLHVVGLIYTSDFNYAFKDLRIKLPLLLLPLIISTTKPLSEKGINLVLQLLVGATVIGTLVSTLILKDVIHRQINDIRDVSIYISHIRFALLICVAIFISFYFAFKSSVISRQLMWYGLVLWFVIFLIMMESLTGLVALFIALFVILTINGLKSRNNVLKYGVFLLFCSSAAVIVYYVKTIADENKQKEVIDFKKADIYTAKGNLYEHDTLSKVTENGHLLWAYYSINELKDAWNKRSTVEIDSMDGNGNAIYFTLFRFLTSKGLRKDSVGVFSLTKDEIKAVERGVTNVNYQSIASLRGRIYETLWEIDLYKKTGEASGHSLTQRFEYWKTAVSIIRNNFLCGVGTGDVPKAFEQAYEQNNSSLDKKWRLRAHNQYLSITVAFGVLGLIWFLMAIIYPLLQPKKDFHYLYIAFFVIAAVSFFTEDTLETQAGVTFYAFLNSFLLFAKSRE